MARIRSIHPGLPTDEAYMSMSAFAKAAWPVLWTECDDHGVFEWKPLVLKARILPADQVDFSHLLAEWEGLGSIQSFDEDGKRFGVVRNFCKFQRPKKPSCKYPFPDEFRTYAGIKTVSTEPVPHQDGTEGEEPPQMEDEGGRREDEGEGSSPETVEHFPSTAPSQASGAALEGKSLEPEDQGNLTRATSSTVVPLEQPDPDEIPAALDRRAYPDDFEELWKAYRPIAAKNATKFDASRSFVRLSKPDKRDCRAGLERYVAWMTAERAKRADYPAKHLATFINKRAWEPFLEDADAPATAMEWLSEDDDRYSSAEARFVSEHGRPPAKFTVPRRDGRGRFFPADWLHPQPERKSA